MKLVKFISIISILLIFLENVIGARIRSQGHHISYLAQNNKIYVQAFRFFITFDVDISSLDYLEIYFPFNLRNSDQTYPKLRIVDYGDSTKYSSSGLDYYNQNNAQFISCVSGGTNNIIYFQIPSNLKSQQLYVIEIIPEIQTYNTQPSVAYNLDAVGMKVVSINQMNSYITYASSTNIASLKLQDPPINNYSSIVRTSTNTYGISLDQNMNADLELQSLNGGYLIIEIVIAPTDQIIPEFLSCTISQCSISENKRLISISFSGQPTQMVGDIVLSDFAQVKQSFSFNSYVISRGLAFYKANSANAFLFGKVLSSNSNTFVNNNNLILRQFLYHWRLPKDTNGEIALFVSSNTKHVYNKITIQFSADKNYNLSDLNSDYFQLALNLGSNYKVLEGSYFTNFVSVSSTKQVKCIFSSSQIICQNIKEIKSNYIYEISMKVVIFNSSDFKLSKIDFSYFSGTKNEVILSVPAASLNSLLFNFATNVDTTQYGSNSSWSSYLSDTQVISVEDVGTNNADTVVKRSFYTTTDNKGGAIVISRGVESLIFFQTIDPNQLCNGGCTTNDKIIKMSLIANNNFLKLSSSDTSGLSIAAQNSGTTTYSFSGLDCSKTLVGCYDNNGSAVQNNGILMNGKQVDTTFQIAKYTLRCGIPGVALQPMDACGKMFQGMESNLNTFVDGMGGVFYIKQVDISNSFIPSRVVADDQSPDFMITFSLEDPMNISSPGQITIQTMINAYVISYHSTDNVGFNANFVNFSKDSQGLYNPSLLRLRVTNPMNNKKLIIFLDNSIQLTSFIDQNDNSYSCQVITSSDTLASYDKTKCLAFKGIELLNSSNYMFHNVLVVDINNIVGRTYYEVLVPLSPSQLNLFDSTFLYVGYGVLIDDFNKGLPSFAIQELISIYGITSKGPTLQNAISPFFSASTTLNEDLTGIQKLYGYPGPQQPILYTLNINKLDSSIQFTDGMNSINVDNIKNDGTSFDAGVILTSILQDPFQGQVELMTKTGTFPNQTGKCFKFSYYMYRENIDLSTPLGKFQNAIRFSVFCPFDDAATALTVPEIKIFNSYSQTNGRNQFILAQATADNSVIAIAISEKKGRNISQQNVGYNTPFPFISAQATITSPQANFNVNIKYSFSLNFNILALGASMPKLYYNLMIEITVDSNFLSGNYIFNEVNVILNTSIKVRSTFVLSLNILKIRIYAENDALGLDLNSIDIQSDIVRTDSTSTLGNTNINFLYYMYYELDYYPRITQEMLYFSTQKYSSSLVFSYGVAESLNALIEKPIFNYSLEGSRDILKFNFQILKNNSNKSMYKPSEIIKIQTGFLRNPIKSQDHCLFFTDDKYTQIDHNIAIFQNYQISFKKSFDLANVIYVQCQGVQVYDSTNANTYSIQYLNALSVDMISSVQRQNELILASWTRPLPAQGLSIQQISFENKDGGINSLVIIFSQDQTKITQSYQGEYIVYFPEEIDLNEHMYTFNMESTTTYIPEKNALRIKIQSTQLDNPIYQLNIFPVYVTKQLIAVSTNRFIYVEKLDVIDKKVIDYSYYSLGIDFSLFLEKQLTQIHVTSASLKYGIQKSIDTLSLSYKIDSSYSPNIKIIIYTRIGSQMYLKPFISLTAYGGGGNGYFQNFDLTSISQNNIITSSYDSIITSQKSLIHDLAYIPVYIYLYINGDLQAMTFLDMQSLVALTPLTDSTTFQAKLFSYFADPQGDYISVLALYKNIAEINQQIIFKELNDHSIKYNSPLLGLSTATDIRDQKSLFIFSQYQQQNNQILSQLYLTSDLSQKQYMFSYQDNSINNQIIPSTQIIKNTYTPCTITSEFSKYFVQQSENGVVIRIFFDDYCKILDPTVNVNTIQITPSTSSNLISIVDTVPITLSSNRVGSFKINISPTAVINNMYSITYTVSGMFVQIQTTEVWVTSPQTGSIDLSKVTISPSYNQATLNIECLQNKLIYFEINLVERSSNFLSDTDLKSNVQDGLVKQIDFDTKLADKLSTRQIGSVQCNPLSTNSIVSQILIKNLRDSTKYKIKLYSPDSQTSIQKDFTTSSSNLYLLYMSLQIIEDDSLSKQVNPNLIRSQFLCYLSYYLTIPHTIIKLSGFPSISCQDYLDTNPTVFSPSLPNQLQTQDEICSSIQKDNTWLSEDQDTSINQSQFYPKEFANDTNIFIEMDKSANQNNRIDVFTIPNGFQLQNMNYLATGNLIRLCYQYKLKSIKNQGNAILPEMKLTDNSCSEKLRCSVKFELTQGSSILYIALAENELPSAQREQLNVQLFRQNSNNFLKRFVHPIDSINPVEFVFYIPEADSKFYLYYFQTDLTLSDSHYQFPGINLEIIEFITTYSATLLVLYILLPVIAAIVIGGIYYGVKHIRKRNQVGQEIKGKEIQNQGQDLLENEDLEQIKELENNRVDNILQDLDTEKVTQVGDKEKYFKCSQIVSNSGKVDMKNMKKKQISSKVINQQYKGDLNEIEEVILL